MGVSRRDGDMIIGLVNIILFLVFRQPDGVMRSRHEDVISQMPQSINAAISKFDLDSRTTIYAACPSCHFLYEPTFKIGSTVPIYPEHCANHPHLESPKCGDLLLRRGSDGKRTPIKPFVFHDFNDYLAGLLSRSDLEEAMDRSCDTLMEQLEKPPVGHVRDIWQAEFLREMKGPDGKTLFVDRGTEGRYLFSMNVDFLNIEGMRIRGAKTSVGLISMVCLSLPAEIRYKPENMYVGGIIPGPNQPSLTELNPYIEPLVDQLKSSWHRGTRFSRTALHPSGRSTRCALANIVTDLPAARHVSGLAHFSSHHFCTVCQCYHVSTLSNIDHVNWKERDNDSLRKHAEEWRDASSEKDREAILTKYGTRWSPLWKLPYWNPARQLIVDVMHGILERFAHLHFRSVLRLTSEAAAAPPSVPLAFRHNFKTIDPDREAADYKMSKKEAKQVTNIHGLITAPLAGVCRPNVITDKARFDASVQQLRKRLMTKNTVTLEFICRDVGCQLTHKPTKNAWQPKLFKKDWVDALVQWVRNLCYYSELSLMISFY